MLRIIIPWKRKAVGFRNQICINRCRSSEHDPTDIVLGNQIFLRNITVVRIADDII